MTYVKLPDAELDVMSFLWRQGPATVREIREHLQPTRPMAHGSVVTLLKRLEAKDQVTREKCEQSKVFVYRALSSPRPTYRKLARNLMDRVFDGDATALVASLFDARKPNAQELDQLQSLVHELRKKQTNK
jgi:BlaI family transcriptional regulator, penicillinase repressor